jgi:hypothetical protein
MNTDKLTDESQISSDPLYGINEALLHSEIGFWQEMIDSSDESMAPDQLERMHQALALAKSRLAGLVRRYRQARDRTDHSSGNVYCIKNYRAWPPQKS